MVGEYRGTQVREYDIHPEDFGLTMAGSRALKVATPAESREVLMAVLADTAGAPRDIVALNAGVALYAANVVASMADGVRLASATIASGAARAKLEQFIQRTRELRAP
jgi:anthranilate phosphoribosyltransferase